jgi:hypothetical protein
MFEHFSHIAVLVLQLFIDTLSESYYVQWLGSVWWRLNSKISSDISSWDLLGRPKLCIYCFQCCSWDMTPLTSVYSGIVALKGRDGCTDTCIYLWLKSVNLKICGLRPMVHIEKCEKTAYEMQLGHWKLYNPFHSWFQTFAMFWMPCAFFWVILRHLNFICQCFGTLSFPSS